MYHTIILPSETRACRLLNSLHSRPAFASANIKSMCFYDTVQLATAAEVIQLCSGIDDLALWVFPAGDRHIELPVFLLDALDRLPLSRLSIRLSAVFCTANSMPFLPSIPLFSKITHLELMDGWVLWGSPIGIHCLTQLTHISLRMFPDQTAPALLQTILAECTLLQVLILRVTEKVDKVDEWLLEHEGLDDLRIVVTTKKHLVSDGIPSLWEYGDCITNLMRHLNTYKQICIH
jgi:hypothetical protein